MQMREAKNKLDEAKRIASQPGDPAEQRAKRKMDDLMVRWNELWDDQVADHPRADRSRRHEGKPLDPDREIIEAQTASQQAPGAGRPR